MIKINQEAYFYYLMKLYSYIEWAMKIFYRERTNYTLFDSTVSSIEFEVFFKSLLEKDPLYWKNLEEKELIEILRVLENILSVKENNHRALVILNDYSDDIVSVIYINRVYKTKPVCETNSLFRFDIMKLKKNEKSFFCIPVYYEKMPINIVKTLIELGKLSSVSEI